MKIVIRLSPRDMAVLDTVELLEQASSGQLQRLCFSQPELSEWSYGVRTRAKLLRLKENGYLRRFPSVYTDGWVYLPAHSKATRIDHHTLDIAEVYTRLTEASRLGMCEIREWVVREQITGKYADDAYLWLKTPLKGTHWHLEIDRGSENKAQLREKMRAYNKALEQSDDFPYVLYVVSFNPRGSLQARAVEIASVIKEQTTPELFSVVTLDNVVAELVGK